MSEGHRWDERYRELAHAWPTHPDPDLVALAGAVPPGRASDLGCGTGRNALWLAAQGWRVTAVDASEVGLAHARARADEAGLAVDFAHADLQAYVPEPGAFDLVVLANVHLDPAVLAAVYGAAAAGLAPGGHLFVVGHHLDVLGRGMGGPPDPDRLFTVERVRDAVPGVVWERLERVERRGPSGSGAPSAAPGPEGSAGAPGADVTDVVVVGWGHPQG